jgi:anti-sigma factor RsiW
MNCSDELIGGYLDQELDLSLQVALEQHLLLCELCFELCDGLRTQRDAIRSQAPYYPAPARLEREVAEALGKNAEAERGTLRQALAWRRVAIAASILLAASMMWNAANFRHAQGETVAQTLIASHIRSLMGNHLLDVPSTDQHTVRPWFNGRTAFSPEVRDFGSQGFPLAGGRLDYADGQTVAAIIYRRRQHLINLYTWPTSPAYPKESQFARNGFNVLQWSDRSMTYWIVSDLDSTELKEFRRLCGR